MAGRILRAGTRVRVTQIIRGRDTGWTTQVEGEVLSHAAEKTGSWFAHGRHDRVWLDRIRLRKDDGEVTALNLDQHSQITILQEPVSSSGKS